MKIIDKLKSKAVLWAITAFTDEKYKARRAILTPIIRAKIDGYFEGVQMEEEKKPEESKSKWKSKTFITAVVTVLVGAIQPISTALGHSTNADSLAVSSPGSMRLTWKPNSSAT